MYPDPSQNYMDPTAGYGPAMTPPLQAPIGATAAGGTPAAATIQTAPSPFTAAASQPSTQPPAGAGSPTLAASFGGPVPAGQVPPPSVNASVVYTDPVTGKGYNPNELSTAWASGQLQGNPLNARVPDILAQYNLTPGQTNPIYSPTPSTPGASAAGGTPAATTLSPTGMSDPRASAFFDMLMGKISASPDVSASDPTIAAQTEAFRNDLTRAGRDALSAAAESGGPFFNPEAMRTTLAERAGQATGGFQANLMAQEREARRQQIAQALGLAPGFLTSEQQQKLQAELDQQQLQERAYEFDTGQAYQYSPFASGAMA